MRQTAAPFTAQFTYVFLYGELEWNPKSAPAAAKSFNPAHRSKTKPTAHPQPANGNDAKPGNAKSFRTTVFTAKTGRTRSAPGENAINIEVPRRDVGADPSAVAEIAERLGRVADAKHWLTVAAESGDTRAMLRLIEEYDQGDLARSWTWVYLSRLVGTDLSKDDHYAINEDGSEYDDDVGGPAYAAGRDGVDLESLSAE